MILDGIDTLYFNSTPNPIPWNSGVAKAFPIGDGGNDKLVLAVECRLGNLDNNELALFDTAAAWSIIGPQFVEDLEGQYLIDDPSIKTLHSRLGEIKGPLARLNIRLPSIKGYGQDLVVESTVMIAKDWDGSIVLGYRGFLERIRFAFSPQNDLNTVLFYFGSEMA